MIKLKNVSKYYNSNGIITVGLKDINLEFNKGEIVAITGESGSGKSTLLNVISCVDNYDEGELYFYDEETSFFDQNDMDAFRKNYVGFVYQKYNIIDSYTVLENVMLPYLIQGKTKKEAKKLALKLIKKVNLIKRVKSRGSELSGGEKQRLVIARALAKDSKILACDEPTGNLDKESGREIYKLIKEISKDRLVLIVTHNYEDIKDIATRKIKLFDGKVVEDETILKVNEDQKEKCNLKTNKVKGKSIFNISFLNMLRTPKKSCFLGLVYFLISSIFLGSYVALNTNFGVRNSTPIINEDKVLVYNKNHEALNKDDFKFKNQKFNSFYEDIPVPIGIDDYYTSKESYYFTNTRFDYELMNGVDELNDEELLLVMPEKQNTYISLNSNVYYMPSWLKNKNNDDYIGRIKGIAKSKWVNEPVFIFEGDFKNTIYQKYMSYYSDIVLEYDDTRVVKYLRNVYYNKENNITYVSAPLKYKNSLKIKTIFKSTYEFKNNIDVVYENTYDEPTLIFGKDAYDQTLDIDFNTPYEALIYVDNVNEAINRLNKLGYSTLYAYDDQLNAVPYQKELSLAINSLIFIILIILFFISYIIISRIFMSKTKDYGILRSIGLMNQDLNKVILIENIFNSVSSSIISLAITSILLASLKLKEIYLLNVGFIISYFVIMILFSGLIGYVFNHKIFTNSVNKVIKEGDEL